MENFIFRAVDIMSIQDQMAMTSGWPLYGKTWILHFSLKNWKILVKLISVFSVMYLVIKSSVLYASFRMSFRVIFAGFISLKLAMDIQIEI